MNETSGPEIRMKALLDGMGLKYVEQLSVRSGFVIDFAFPDKMLALEVDGFYHQFTKRRDNFRDYILRRAGWTILRIQADALGHTEQIENLVQIALNERHF